MDSADEELSAALETVLVSRYTLKSLLQVLEQGRDADPQVVSALVDLLRAELGEAEPVASPDDAQMCVFCGTLQSNVWVAVPDEPDKVLCDDCSGPMLRGSKRGH